MPTATVNGTQLYYEEVGEGPTCLVAHGWLGSDHTYMRPGLDLLARHLRLVYYDHRAHGRSGGEGSGPVTVEQLAGDAVALGAHLDPGPVLLLGHHHGAAVVQEAAIGHPDRVAGIVLVGASPGELGKQESLADFLDTPPTPPEVEVLQRVPPGTDEEWAATMQALAKFFYHRVGTAEREAPFARARCRAEAAAAAMMSLGWWSCVDRLPSVTAPALVVVGRHDVFHPPYQSERIARHLPGATLAVLDECAHLPWVEAPDAVVEALAAWLPVTG